MIRPLALVFAAALLLAPRASDAKTTVALTEIEGDTSGDVREAVAEALEGKELSLIASKEVNRAVGKLGDVADLTEKDFKKLANELEADAIVLGKLERARGTRTLKFRLFVHKKMAKGFTVSFKDPRSEKFRAALHDKMVDKLGATAGDDAEDDRPAHGKRSDDDRPARPKREDRAADGDQDEGRGRDAPEAAAKSDRKDKRSKRARSDDDSEEPRGRRAERDSERDDGEAAPRKTRKKVASSEDRDEGDETDPRVTARVERTRPANQIALRADVGVSLVRRSFKFTAEDIPERPKNLALSPVPGVRFEIEGYPLALNKPSSLLAGLGFAVEYDKTLSLSLSSKNAMGTFNAPVKQMRYSLGVRYRYALGKSETSPTITAGIGYGKRLFTVDLKEVTDPQANLELRRDAPSTAYTVLDPGITFRLPVTRAVAFVAGGRGLLITRTGKIQTGESYGRARVYGAQVLAALDVVLGKRFALRISGDFAQIGYTFDGVGALSNGLDDDPEPDVGGLTDRSIGGAATVAVMY